MGDFTQTLFSINYAMDLITGAILAGGVGFFYYRPDIPKIVKEASVATMKQTLNQAVTSTDKIIHPKDAGDFFEGLGGYVSNVMSMTNGGYVANFGGNIIKGL